jgi:hypothetical protein
MEGRERWSGKAGCMNKKGVGEGGEMGGEGKGLGVQWRRGEGKRRGEGHWDGKRGETHCSYAGGRELKDCRRICR